MKRYIKESLPILVLCGLGEIFLTGMILKNMSPYLIKVIGLFVLIPTLMSLRGNISGSLGSRISSGLHQGLINPEFEKNDDLLNNIKAAVLMTTLLSFLAGIFAYFISILYGLTADILELVTIAFIAGSLAGVVFLIFTLNIAFFTFKRGLDPDNMVNPIMTFVSDFTTIFFIYLAILILALI